MHVGMEDGGVVFGGLHKLGAFYAERCGELALTSLTGTVVADVMARWWRTAEQGEEWRGPHRDGRHCTEPPGQAVSLCGEADQPSRGAKILGSCRSAQPRACS